MPTEDERRRFTFRAYVTGMFIGNIAVDATTVAEAREIIQGEHDYVTSLIFDHVV